jgi:hypothetical protein
MWEFGDGEGAVFIGLISLFLSVCCLEKFLLSHGVFIVLQRSSNVPRIIVISIVIVEKLPVLAFVFSILCLL